MIRADQHLHTWASPDSEADPAAYAAAAAAQGLTHLTLTDHLDLGHQNPIFTLPPPPAKLVEAAERLQQAAGDSLTVCFGVECGYIPAFAGQIADYVAECHKLRPLDFILLSVHEVNGLDPYDPAYFAGRSRTAAYQAYLEAVLASVESSLQADAIGHIGYVWKYAKLENPVLHYAEFPALLDRILTRIIARGCALEVNTSAMSAHGQLLPPADILARYYALGGRLITFGSDAHAPERLGLAFDAAAQACREIGFTHYALFCGRRMTLQPI